MQKEVNQGHKMSQVACVEQGSKMNDIFLKQGKGLNALAAHHYKSFL